MRKYANKKGSAKGMIMWAVGVMILVQALIQVFGTSGLANTNFTATAPAMLIAVFPLLIIAAVVGFVLKSR